MQKNIIEKTKNKGKKQKMKEYENSKLKFQTFEHSGITLIALVVTIIILLILASISINVIFSDEGIIKRAQRIEQEQRKAELLETIDIIKLKLKTDKIIDGKEITPEDFFDALEKEGIISDPEIGGNNIQELPKENEDDNPRYEVTTDDNIVIEVEIPKDPEDRPEDIEVEYIGPTDGVSPIIKIKNIESTTNSIHLEVEVSRIKSGDTISYYYKKLTDTGYTTFKEGVTDQTIDITNLEQGQIYIIQIVAKNEKSQTIKQTEEIFVGKLEEGTISPKSGPTWVGDGTATLELQTSATVGYMEYQIVTKDEISEEDLDDTKWIKYTEMITELKHKDIVFVRLTDGTNATEDYLTVEVKDTVEPTVQITKGTVTTKEINVTVTSSDNESGMDASPTYKYYIKKSTDTEYPTTAEASGQFATYKFEDLDAGTEYDVKITTTDRAENEGYDEELKIATRGIAGATENLQTGTILATSNWVGDGTATVTLVKNITDETLYIEYRITKNETAGNWTTYENTITGLEHLDKVEARLTDGRNIGKEAAITIKDSTAPTVSVTSSSKDKSSISVTVSASDGESGIASDATYKFSIIGGAYSSYTVRQNTTSKSFSQSGLSASTTYTVKIEVTNRAGITGNTTKSITTSVATVPVSSISVSPSSMTLFVGETGNVSATVSPDSATDKSYTWSSNKTTVATVSSSGRVTAVAAGTATITATSTNGSKTDTCTVTVKEAVAKIGTTNYATLQAAVNSVSTNNTQTTVELLKNVSEEIQVKQNQNINFDLNGKTISARNIAIVNNGTIKLSDGTLTSEDSNVINNLSTGTVTISGTAKLQNDGKKEGETTSYSVVKNAGSLTIQGGTLTSTEGMGIYNIEAGIANLSGGTVTSEESHVIFNESTGTITISGTVNISNDGNKAGVTVGVPAVFNEKGTLKVQGGTISSVDGHAVVIEEGTATISAGTITSENNTVISNKSTGTVTISGNAKLSNDGDTTDPTSSPVINNSGTLKIQGGTISSVNSNAISNMEGTATISGGTISSEAMAVIANNLSGTATISGTAKLSNEGSMPAAWNAGIMKIQGGTISAVDNPAVYNWDGTTTITSGTISSVNTYAVYVSDGTTTISGGTLTSSEYHAIYNGSEGTVTISGTANISNDGTKTGSTSTYSAIYNYGTLKIQGGTISSISGNVVANNGGSVTVTSGTLKSDESHAIWNKGVGTVTISGGTLTAEERIVVWNEGTKTVTISGGTLTSVNAQVVYNEQGTVTISGGTLRTEESNVAVNDSAGTMTISGTAKLSNNGSGGINPALYNNMGILKIQGGTITSVDSYALYNNGGTVTISSGTISSTNEYGVYNLNSGKVTITGGSISSKYGC